MRGLVLALALAACNPYDKDLGPAPFLCGPTDPRCPMGYACAKDPTTGDDVCVNTDTTMPGSFNCADDSALEPNDTTQSATPTGLDAMKMFVKDGLAICPTGDKDLFAITIATASEDIEVIIEFDPSAAQLVPSILSATGVSITTGMPVTGSPGMARAFTQNLPTGSYFAQVSGPATAPTMNNYKLTINIAP